jgi:hypothetical protein
LLNVSARKVKTDGRFVPIHGRLAGLAFTAVSSDSSDDQILDERRQMNTSAATR